ncbi:MAG: hypothetical protein VYD64_05125, partial [Pseudomonadota bacterium]|nr:hypothetical protein [Pseudomonadota bacterium]
FEVEAQFAKLVEPMLGVKPLDTSSDESASTSEADAEDSDSADKAKSEDGDKTESAKAEDDKDPETPDYKDADYRDDAFKDDDTKKGKLTLSVDVKNTDVFVDEKLSFNVTASDSCELQIFYVEADGNVEVIPQEMIGEAFLGAEKARRIPDPATGDLVFDSAAENETLLLFCRTGGLGDKRLSADDAKKLAKKSKEPAARGLAIQLFEDKKAEEKKDASVKGVTAIHMVTFNVKARE